MDELKLGQNLEKQMEKESQKEFKQAVNDDIAPNIDPKAEGKKVIFAILGILIIFGVAFGGFKYYNGITAANVVDVDDLHKQNIDGELDESEGYMYNGYSFIYADGLWWTEIKQTDRTLKIPLRFGPREVENVTISGKLDPTFNYGEDVIMAIDPYFANKYYTLSLSELNSNIASGIRKKPVGACTSNNTDVCEGRPILNCNNTEGKALVELRYEEPAAVRLHGTCILITGTDFDLVRAADRLIWQWYGVMK